MAGIEASSCEGWHGQEFRLGGLDWVQDFRGQIDDPSSPGRPNLDLVGVDPAIEVSSYVSAYPWPHDEPYSGDDSIGDLSDHSLGLVVELVAHDGEVVDSAPVADLTVVPSDAYRWVAVFVNPPDYRSYRLVRGPATIVEEARSAAALTLSIERPVSGEVIGGSDEARVSWSVSGSEREAHYRIYFSTDGGASYTEYGSWQGLPLSNSVALSRTEPLAAFPVAVEEAKVRVVLSAGLRWTMAETPVFKLAAPDPEPPTVSIVDPEHGDVFGPGDSIALSAEAWDLEDLYDQATGTLPYSPQRGGLGTRKIHWRSDIAGNLNGSPVLPRSLDRLDAGGLTPGVHLLTATITDSSGRTASDAVTITVLGPDNPIQAVDDTARRAQWGDPSERLPTIIDVLANDVETRRRIDPDTLRIVVAPAIGVAVATTQPLDPHGEPLPERLFSGAVIEYAAPGYDVGADGWAEDRFTYEVCDSGPEPSCSTAEVTVNIVTNG